MHLIGGLAVTVSVPGWVVVVALVSPAMGAWFVVGPAVSRAVLRWLFPRFEAWATRERRRDDPDR